MNQKSAMWAAIISTVYALFALGGFITDAINCRWGWVVAEVFTGSLVAGLRGLYLFFGMLFGG